MILATICIHGVRALPVNVQPIPKGIVGGQVQFEYTDSMWAGLTKTVVFRAGNVTKDILDAAELVDIPPEVVAEVGSILKVGVYGEGTPTLWADLGRVRDAADPSGDESTDPTLPVWAQLQEQIDKLRENGPEGPSSPGRPEEDGGYYTPSVSQPDPETVQFDFTPSKPDMPAVAPATVTLPKPDSGGNVDLTGVVKSVNGQTPDENGNVEIAVSGGGGLSATASALLINILRNGVYSTDQSANITALEVELALGGGGSGGSGGSGGGEASAYTVVYTLAEATIDNNASAVAAGASYTATITPNTGYELDTVTVLMGGVDVTADVYADGVITIESVTGNVIIRVTTVEASDTLYKLSAPVTFTGTEGSIDTYTKINAEDIDYTVCVKITCDSAPTELNNTTIVYDSYPYGLSINWKIGYNKVLCVYAMSASASPDDSWRVQAECQSILVVTHAAGSGVYDVKLAYQTKEGRESYSPSSATRTGATFTAVTETIKFGYTGFVGTFDDLIIYNRVLSDEEITAYLES